MAGFIELTAADLDALAWDVTAKRLPFTTGFFFGQSANNQQERDADLAFIAKARQALAAKLCVYYTAWW